MSRRKVEQATLIVLDIGRNVAESENKNEKSFFENARECTSRIIERKIIAQEKNTLGIILIGSQNSDNGFKHIEISVPLQAPTWQMIRELPKSPTKYKGNWFDALLIAAQHFVSENEFVKILNKKIILITNFQAHSNLVTKEVDPVLNGFRDNGIEVDVIGPDLYEDDKNAGIQFAKQFLEVTNGSTASFDVTKQYLSFHKKKEVKPIPWNVELSIGPNIKIPVSSYIRTKDEPIIKNWLKAVRDPVTNTASSSEGIVKNKVHINTENQAIVEHSDIIKGYHYGGQFIPISKYEKSLLYDSGTKCLSVYGFTNAKNVSWQALNGDGLSYIIGRHGDRKAQKAIRCLAESLHELDLVAIARRVYNNGFAPKMVVLMPLIDTNSYVCLSMIGISFNDKITHMAFPPTNLKKYECTKAQVDVFKDLIKSMDLTKAYDESEFDDTEAFPMAEVVSPSIQYMLDSITYRALNPGKPLPPPRSDILTLFQVPPLIEQRSKEPLEKLKNMFVLKKIENKKRERKPKLFSDEKPTGQEICSNLDEPMSHYMPKIKINIEDNIREIGTVDPINDFCALKKQCMDLNDLLLQISDVIEKMIHCNIDGNYNKALSTLTFLRKECSESNPSFYNNWLHKFRMELIYCNKKNVIDMFVEQKLSFILKSENSLSLYISDSIDDNSQLYENDTEPSMTGVTISSQINELFDNI